MSANLARRVHPRGPTASQAIAYQTGITRPRLSILTGRATSKPLTAEKKLATMASATTFYDFQPKNKKGEAFPTADLKGKVVLVVNTATKCGFTPQFKGLEQLYKEVKAAPNGENFEILGFPCNQFGNQNPEDDDGTQSFCEVNYGVSFPILGKLDVNGKTADPMFEWLKKEQPGLLGMKRVKWNFEKFLVGKDGNVKGRWASTTKPADLKAAVEKELKA